MCREEKGSASASRRPSAEAPAHLTSRLDTETRVLVAGGKAVLMKCEGRSTACLLRLAAVVGITVLLLAACQDRTKEGTEVSSRGKAPPATELTLPATTTTTLPTGLPPGDDTTITRIVDGDTIEVAGGVKVRLIGVDTPETVDPRTPPQCFGAEASAHTKELLPVGTPVRLAYDLERLDRYGRTLGYVFRLTDGLFVNLAVVRDGFAQQLTIPPNVAHAEEFRRAVAEARSANRGLWSRCSTMPTAPAATSPPATSAPRTAPPATRAPTTDPPSPRGNCHPSYVGACVPVASDVDCGDGSGNGPAYVYEKNFRVVGPDEYGLDADNDGIGCESR